MSYQIGRNGARGSARNTDRHFRTVNVGGNRKTSRNVYMGLYGRWSRRRYDLGNPPYLPTLAGREDTADDDAISYVSLNSGPLERGVGTVQNRIRAICYFHKVRDGTNPLKGMARLQNLTIGARRGDGPSKRKMPVTADDLGEIYDAIDWGGPKSVTLWRSVSISWFSF